MPTRRTETPDIREDALPAEARGDAPSGDPAPLAAHTNCSRPPDVP